MKHDTKIKWETEKVWEEGYGVEGFLRWGANENQTDIFGITANYSVGILAIEQNSKMWRKM